MKTFDINKVKKGARVTDEFGNEAKLLFESEFSSNENPYLFIIQKSDYYSAVWSDEFGNYDYQKKLSLAPPKKKIYVNIYVDNANNHHMYAGFRKDEKYLGRANLKFIKQEEFEIEIEE